MVEVGRLEDFYFPFWGLNRPENSSSFPPPSGGETTQQNPSLFPRNAQKKRLPPTRVCRATTTSFSLPIATAFNILWLLKGGNDMEEMQKKPYWQQLVKWEEFCFIVVFFVGGFWFLCFLVNKLVRLMILVFFLRVLDVSLAFAEKTRCMVGGILNCFAIAISIHVPSQAVNFLIPFNLGPFRLTSSPPWILRTYRIFFGVLVFRSFGVSGMVWI